MVEIDDTVKNDMKRYERKHSPSQTDHRDKINSLPAAGLTAVRADRSVFSRRGFIYI